MKSIKLHYRHVHADIYHRFCQTAAADCRKVGHLISPCVYCGARITRTDQHSSTCPVLWQARVCCLVQADFASKRIAEPAPVLNSASSSHGACAHADGLGRRGEAVLRESPRETSPCAGSGVAEQVSPPGRERRPATGRRQTATPPTKPGFPSGGPLPEEPRKGGIPRKIGDFFGPAAAQGGQGTHRPVGLSVPSPKRSHGHLHISEWRRPSTDGAAPPRSGGQLARPTQQGQSHQIPQADSAPVCDGRNHHQSHHVCERPECPGQGTGNGLGDERLGVQLSRLECRGTETRPSTGGDANTRSGPGGRSASQDPLEGAGIDHQVLSSSQCPTRLHLGNGDIRPGALATNPGSSRGNGHLQEVVCLVGSPASVTASQAGPPGAVAADQGDSGGGGLVIGRGLTFSCAPAVPHTLADVVLHNPGNHCYLNSTVYLLAYACCLHAPHGPLRGATKLECAVHSVIAHPGVRAQTREQLIANLPAWRSLLEEWQNLHLQQDCMELLHHLLERNPLPFANCQWEARPVRGTAAARRPLIRGTTYVNVPLPRRAHATLQECVVQWHEQKIPHGLTVAPPILFVSLARYASIARGKNPIRLPCKAMQKVSFPVFRGTDHDITWTSYTLVAGIMHLGHRPPVRTLSILLSASRMLPRQPASGIYFKLN